MYPSPENRSDFYVHPNIYSTTDTLKGKGTASRVDLEAGTLVFIDNPYALVPTVALASDNRPLCSRLQCSRKIVYSSATVSCPYKCSPEVVWCDSECQKSSTAEHELECSWLRAHANSILQEIIIEDFYTLWLIVRVLAQRHVELSNSTTSIDDRASQMDERFASDWNVFDRLRSNQDSLQPLKLKCWRTLIKKYLVGKHTMLLHSLNAEEMLTLICRVETNHYDLWPNLIGIWPLPASKADRAESCRSYAYAMYLRTPFLNHSCIPNVSFLFCCSPESLHEQDE